MKFISALLALICACYFGVVIQNVLQVLLSKGYGIIVPNHYLKKAEIYNITITPEMATVFVTFIYFVFAIIAMIVVASIKSIIKPTKDSVAMLFLASLQSWIIMYRLDSVSPPELGLPTYIPSYILLGITILMYIEVHDAKIKIDDPS